MLLSIMFAIGLCASIIGFVGGMLCVTGFFDYVDDQNRKVVSYTRIGRICAIASFVAFVVLLILS